MTPITLPLPATRAYLDCGAAVVVDHCGVSCDRHGQGDSTPLAKKHLRGGTRPQPDRGLERMREAGARGEVLGHHEVEHMTPQANKRFLTDNDRPPSATTFLQTFPKIPALVVDYKRCGKPGCRCERGKLHGPYHYLRWRQGSRQQRRYVPRRDVRRVRAILEQRHEQRRAERLALAQSFRTWRDLGRLIEDYEAQLGAEGGDA